MPAMNKNATTERVNIVLNTQGRIPYSSSSKKEVLISLFLIPQLGSPLELPSESRHEYEESGQEEVMFTKDKDQTQNRCYYKADPLIQSEISKAVIGNANLQRYNYRQDSYYLSKRGSKTGIRAQNGDRGIYEEKGQ